MEPELVSAVPDLVIEQKSNRQHPHYVRGSKILLAEDNPDNQELIRLLLEPLQVELTVVNNGTEAFWPHEYTDYLNKGVIKNPKHTKIDKFIETGKKFFKDFDKLKHIGSMYTIRTVLANRDHDDARPTLVNHEGGNVYSLFSGKIDTCVDSANELVRKLNGQD